MSENNNKQKRKRVCPNCGRKLWLREFYPLKNGGRRSWCHECVLEYKRERYRKTRKVPDGTFMHRTQGRIVEHNGYSTRIFWNCLLYTSTVIFAFWDGEEKGLLGSKYFVQSCPFISQVKGYLNFDNPVKHCRPAESH